MKNLASGLISQKKPTSQSSTCCGAKSSRAVDGNTNAKFNANSCTHTNLQKKAWWQVDLLKRQAVGKVVVYNRSDCCGSRLNFFEVWVDAKKNCGKISAAKALNTIDCKGYVGRKVKVQLVGRNHLTLCEVKIYSPGMSRKAEDRRRRVPFLEMRRRRTSKADYRSNIREIDRFNQRMHLHVAHAIKEGEMGTAKPAQILPLVTVKSFISETQRLIKKNYFYQMFSAKIRAKLRILKQKRNYLRNILGHFHHAKRLVLICKLKRLQAVDRGKVLSDYVRKCETHYSEKGRALKRAREAASKYVIAKKLHVSSKAKHMAKLAVEKASKTVAKGGGRRRSWWTEETRQVNDLSKALAKQSMEENAMEKHRALEKKRIVRGLTKVQKDINDRLSQNMKFDLMKAADKGVKLSKAQQAIVAGSGDNKLKIHELRNTMDKDWDEWSNVKFVQEDGSQP